VSRYDNRGRNIALFAGGIAAGIVGSRLLPPVAGIIGGYGRVRAGGDPFARLIEDHRQILSAAERVVEASSDSALRRGRFFLMLKRRLAKHAMAEEDVVYPLVHGQTDGAGESKHLYDEHADMKILLFQLEERLKSGEDWSEPARSLRDLIRRHADEEERNVFPRLRQALNRKKLPGISGRIYREEAVVF
jgi:hemerythrin superfamily protein